MSNGKTWPLAIDLFSGCGGLTLGLKQARFRVVGAVDNDSLAVKTYRANHRRVKVWHRDIRELQPTEVMSQLGLNPGDLDLLAGCPPCQGFSAMRTLNRSRRVRDPRNDLLFEYLRFTEAIKPRAVMLENVPGLLKNYRFPRFVKELRRLGYTVTYSVVDAADYNVPQRRRRLVLLGGRHDTIPFAQPAARRRSVREAIGSLASPGDAGDPLHDYSENRSKRIQRLIALVPHDGGDRRNVGADLQLRCHQKCDGFKDVYGRMSWDSVAPTITSGCVNPSKGRFLHPTADRAITLREAALLQSFPPNYRFSVDRGKFAVAEMIGNALPPELVRHQAIAIRGHLSPEQEKQAPTT